jgi:probable rRNA maturation factor
MASINFFSQDISFKVPQPRKTSSWIKTVISAEKQSLKEINFIFCSDKHLLGINQAYLKHNTYTDIITFDTRDSDGPLEGDIFISVDRVKENSLKLHQQMDIELKRVIIHGVLHLLGYGDKTERQIKQMRKKEDAYLSLWQS